MNTSEIIQSYHLQRKACVYIRQSTPHQVLTNQESRRLQYALKKRAEDFGWKSANIELIDSDLGRTASTTEGRKGFESLVAQITLGQVGIVLCYDVSRLARNCSDFYPLMDVCSYRQCLMGDRDGIYDPSTINGRALLGLKGQMSELEMHSIKSRMQAGSLNKAQRGELALRLPTGYVRDRIGRVSKDPDMAVQTRISLIFNTFIKVRTVRSTTRHFIKNALAIPRRDALGELAWRPPTDSAIRSTLKNPTYAGVYTYGRTGAKVKASPEEKGSRLTRPHLPMEKWKVKIDGKYPAYVGWASFEEIQRILQDNHAEYSKKWSRGVPRKGEALLQGIAFCGECGHKMLVGYRKSGRVPRYICMYLRKVYQAPTCQSIQSDPIDDYVTKSFFAALTPAEIDLYSRVVEEKRVEDDELLRVQRQNLDRLRYEARLAERQFNHVDPDNRNVAGELERRWETALQALSDAESDFERRTHVKDTPRLITHKLRSALEDLGRKMPEIWVDDIITREQKKALLRSLVDKVVIHRIAADTIRTRIVWKGGATSEVDVPVASKSLAGMKLAKELEAAILALVSEGKPDAEIASLLTVKGFRSPRCTKVSASFVQSIRLTHNIYRGSGRKPNRRIPGFLSVHQMAAELGVTTYWIYDRISSGSIKLVRDRVTGRSFIS